MRGHEPLITMRKQHRKPVWVSLTLGDRSWAAENWHEWSTQMPHVVVQPQDPIDRLDLRFLMAIDTVDVDADVSDEPRLRKLFDACVRAGARRVIGALHKPRGEGLEILEYMDTAGVLTWQG